MKQTKKKLKHTENQYTFKSQMNKLLQSDSTKKLKKPKKKNLHMHKLFA